MIRFFSAIIILLLSHGVFAKPRVAFTFDDPNLTEAPLFDTYTRNEKILSALKQNNLTSALFVCGKRIDSDSGHYLISTWNDAGHIIANHSYSHYYYHARNMTVDLYRDDFLKADSLLSSFSGFQKLYRYPYLKEGSNEVKRDFFRDVLVANGYSNGHVSIDASDWYIDSRLIKRLKENPNADIAPYKEFYLKHIKERADYYNTLSKELTGRDIDHILLLHHNLVSALFLQDLIDMFTAAGWEVINAGDAYKDEIYSRMPNVIPAGESLIWSLAKETGRYEEDSLRYPAEDGAYEEDEMNRLGL